MKVYYGNWAEDAPAWYHGFTGKAAIEHDFNTTLPNDIEILFAWYSQEGYGGRAFVLFRQDGKLYDVEGSHCSCHGLEDQWIPTETNLQVLRMRHFYDDTGDLDGAATSALDTLLTQLEKTDEDFAA